MGLFRRRDEQLVAIFDIGSGSVGGALVRMSESSWPVVQATVRHQIPPQKNLDEKRYVSLVERTFAGLVEALMGSSDGETPDQVHCFYGSPWFVALCDRIQIAPGEPFVTSEELIEETINEKVYAFEKEQEQTYGSGYLGVPQLVEKENMQVRLNGYEVGRYDGRKADTLETAFFASVIPEGVIDSVEEALARGLNQQAVTHRTSLFASFVVARDLLDQGDSPFFVMEVSGEMTSIAWVREGVIKGETSFALGHNFIIRRLAEHFDMELTEARSLFSLYQAGKAEKDTIEQIERILKRARGEWAEATDEHIRSFARGGTGADQVFLAADGAFAGWFGESIRGDLSLSSSALSETENVADFGEEKQGQARVTFLGPKTLEPFCDFTDDVQPDVFLGLEASFLAYCQNTN